MVADVLLNRCFVWLLFCIHPELFPRFQSLSFSDPGSLEGGSRWIMTHRSPTPALTHRGHLRQTERCSASPWHVVPGHLRSTPVAPHKHARSGSQLVQNEPGFFTFSLVPFVSPKHCSPSFSPLCFFTLSLICIHYTMRVSLPFLRAFCKVRETRPLGRSAASPLLQVSPLSLPPPSHAAHFSLFPLTCLRYPSLFLPCLLL